MIRRIARSYEANRALVDEIVQDIYLALWEALPRFRGDSELRTFLVRVAHNRAITHVAKEARRPRSVELDEALPDPATTPAQAAEDDEARGGLGPSAPGQGGAARAVKGNSKMNEREWHELEELWKRAPSQPEPVVQELGRLRRRRKWVAVEIVASSIIALAGLGTGIALIVSGGTFLVTAGIATCIFVAAVCAISLWALRAPRPRPEDAVGHAVAVARQNAHADVRYAAAMIWGVVVGLVFAAFMTLARGLLTAEATLAGFVAVGGVLLMLAAWLAVSFRYYQTRSAALARLDAIAMALEE